MQDRSKAYTAAGVNIEKGNELVDRIKKLVKGTYSKEVVSDIGGFGGLFCPELTGMQEPTLVATTDGVGTKLKLAFAFNKHDTIGIDLVAMSVNDILVQGARPLFFLDYFATGKLDVDCAEQVIKSVADGCKQSNCALLGGETAEMPSMYADGEYDLAGFCVGIVDKSKVIDGSNIKAGDKIIGIHSTGVHSNGYSLVRKIFDNSGHKKDDIFPKTKKTFQDVLLEPTAIYTNLVMDLLKDLPIKAMCHITGGGFYDNIPRVLPKDMQAKIKFSTWDMLPVFTWLKEAGKLSWEEMLQIFNCSIGYILVVEAEKAEAFIQRIQAKNYKGFVIGEITKKTDDNSVVIEGI